MYYLKVNSTPLLEDEGEQHDLVYYCRKCGHEEAHLSAENICVLNTQISRTEPQFNHLVNPFTKYDPTLPRTSHLKCPNDACISNGHHGLVVVGGEPVKIDDSKMKSTEDVLEENTSDEPLAAIKTNATTTVTTVTSDVVYIRYDDVKLKFIYICTHCDTRWKNDLQAKC